MNTSVIGRLLEEISWEGRRSRMYRQGGRGIENVLSAQVLQALDLLPRTAFLGRIIRDAHGADAARAQVAGEVEDLTVAFLPEETTLSAGGARVQADALLTGPNTLVLVEAKASGRSPFQPAQLSREYLALLQQAGDRMPLMLLMLGAPSPVKVSGGGLLQQGPVLARKLCRLEGRSPRCLRLDQHDGARSGEQGIGLNPRAVGGKGHLLGKEDEREVLDLARDPRARRPPRVHHG